MLNLPNSLTIFRIFLVPVLVVVLLTRFEGKEIFGASIFALGAATDALDGYLARRRRQVTLLGTVLDPIADKLLVSAALFSLIELGLVAAWMVVVIVGREFAVSALRYVAGNRGVRIPVTVGGKLKMGAEVVAVLLLILSHKLHFLWVPGQTVLWVVMGLAVYSGVDYFRQFFQRLGDESGSRDPAIVPPGSAETSSARRAVGSGTRR